MESAVIGLQEAQSFSFWLVSAVFAYARKEGFVPPDPALYSRLSSSLVMSLVQQCQTSHALSAFSTLVRRGHFLKHCGPTVSEDQKGRLLASDPFRTDLFDPEILEKIISEYDSSNAAQQTQAISSALSKSVSSLFSQRAKDTSAPGVPGPSGVASAPSSSSSAQPNVSSPLFDAYPSKGEVQWPRQDKGKGRGGRRGKGGSRFSKTQRGFRK